MTMTMTMTMKMTMTMTMTKKITKTNDKDKYKIQNLLTLMGLYCGTQSFFFFNLHLFYFFRTSALRQCQFARDPNL